MTSACKIELTLSRIHFIKALLHTPSIFTTKQKYHDNFISQVEKVKIIFKGFRSVAPGSFDHLRHDNFSLKTQRGLKASRDLLKIYSLAYIVIYSDDYLNQIDISVLFHLSLIL